MVTLYICVKWNRRFESKTLTQVMTTLPVYLEVLLVVVPPDGLAASRAHVLLPELVSVLLPHAVSAVKVARWQNLISSFPWIALGWRAWGPNPRKGWDQILQCSVAEP